MQRMIQTEDGPKIQSSYIDFIDVQSTSAAVTKYCWDVLQKKFDFSFYNKGIFVWSDTTFRSKSLIEYFLLLAIKLQLTIQFHFIEMLSANGTQIFPQESALFFILQKDPHYFVFTLFLEW
jgi:hypothetical protein